MYFVKAALVKAMLYFCACLPLSWARGMACGVANCVWLLGGSARRVTQKNIQIAFPELSGQAQRELAKQSLQETAKAAAEMGYVWLRPIAQVQGLIQSVSGAELIEEAVAQGRGVLVLAPHFGNWEMMGLHCTQLGNLVSLYEPPHLSALSPLVRRARERSGATLVATDSRGLVQLMKSLKAGKISGILPDQVPPDVASGENSVFMGEPCFTQTLSIKLLRRTGALAFFGAAKRVPGGFELSYVPADEDIYSSDTSLALASMNRGIEACVRSAPAQYQWEYKRFRVRPKTARNHYKGL